MSEEPGDLRRQRHGWVCVAAASLGAALLSRGAVAIGWLDGSPLAATHAGGAWLLGLLLLRRPGIPLASMMMAGAWAGIGASLLSAGPAVDGRGAFGGSALQLLQVALAYALLRYRGQDTPGLRSTAQLAWLTGIAVVVPALVGWVAAMLFAPISSPTVLWRDWTIGAAFAILLVVPAVLAATPGQCRRLRQPRMAMMFVALAVATVAATLLASLELQQTFVVLVLPLLVTALRLGVLATTLLNILAMLLLFGLYRWLPPDQLVGLAPLSMRELMAYGTVSLFAPLLVAVQTENRRHSSRALRDALGQLRLIYDHMPVAIGRIGSDGRYRMINRRYADFLGHQAGDVVGRTPRDVMGDAHAEAVAPHVERALAGERVAFEATVSGRRLDIQYIPHVTDSGPGGFFVLAIDHTERHAAQSALSDEKERIRVTLDSIGDAVIACDNELRITLLNPIAEDMTGWAEADALGRPVDEVVTVIENATGMPVASALRGAVAEGRIAITHEDIALLRRDGQHFAVEDSAAPIHDRDGRIVGGVLVFRDVSETRAMAVKMSHQAQHDPLTQLPNRVLLQGRLEHALLAVPRGNRGALLFIDLDHFKTINESLGHEVGDQVLQEVARRLASTVRADDTVSRQGGDEFAVLLGHLRDPEDAARVAEKMLDALQHPVEAAGCRLHISLSIGIALFPQDGVDMASLMRQADAALYHAKEAGRGRYSYFARSMSEQAEQRLRLEQELRDALQTGGLFLVYQPKVRRPDGQITGMEALVRWRRADGSLVPPMDFIPVAEESELIHLIDGWVMQEACRQSRDWLDAGILPGPMAVNVSLARFDADRLLSRVRQSLESSGLPGEMLEVEFTESQMFADRERARCLIDGLRALKVRIAIDDFGTGYSSLGYLSDHCFDTIKIDRSFVRGLPTDAKQGALVQAIVAMAQALEAGVVAEGVETPEQAATLDGHGCHEVQGFLYSRPVSADELGTMLRGRALAEIPREMPAQGA